MASPALARRRWPWLAAAAFLLLACALLFSIEEPAAARTAPAPEFPTWFRDRERQRQEARRTVELPAPAAPATGPADEPPGPTRQDPFLLALPVKPDQPLVVLEANALRHSRLGELFVQCALADDPDFFEQARRESGLDLLKDVDRVAFAGEAVVVSGFFDTARWERLEGEGGMEARPYGDAGRLYLRRVQTSGPSVSHGPTLAVWRNQVVVFGQDEATVRRSIDQLEGRAPAAGPEALDPLAYGEVYGLLPGEALRRLASPGDRELAARLAAAASRIELHVDAMNDVAAVVRAEGSDPAALGDLGKALGGALAASRLQARATGDQGLAELLDAASVATEGGRLSLEVALPVATLERWFDGCAGRKRPRPEP